MARKTKKLTKEEVIARRKKQALARKSRQRLLMHPGQRCGHLTLIQKVRAPRDCSPATRKRWLVECDGPVLQEDGSRKPCGTRVVVPEMYLRRAGNPKLDCGCQTSTMRSKFNNEYRIWLMIRERTRNPAHIANSHYTSSGIDIIDEWYDLATGFELFFKEVGKRPSRSHSIDRIDNKRGYEPGNLRWATSAQQRKNQGDCVAGYTQVDIEAAGYTRLEFTTLISQGHDEDELISKGKQE